MKHDEIWQHIQEARAKQVAELGVRYRNDFAQPEVSLDLKVRIMTEVLGRVAKACARAQYHPGIKRGELCAALVELAACTLGWLEAEE